MEQKQKRVVNQYDESGVERDCQWMWICSRFLTAFGMTGYGALKEGAATNAYHLFFPTRRARLLSPH